VQTKLHIVYIGMLQLTRSNTGFYLIHILIKIYIWVLLLTKHIFIYYYR